jgi:hypothetical protein
LARIFTSLICGKSKESERIASRSSNTFLKSSLKQRSTGPENDDTPILIAAVEAGVVEIIKAVYNAYPEGLFCRSAFDERLPLHVCLHSEGDWSTVSPTSNSADILRFLVTDKNYPKDLMLLTNLSDEDIYSDYEYGDDEEEISFPYFGADSLDFSKAEYGNYFRRVCHRAIPNFSPKYVCELNYRERRGAMYVLLSNNVPSTTTSIGAGASDGAAVATTATAKEAASKLRLTWLALRCDGRMRDLQRSVLSFL